MKKLTGSGVFNAVAIGKIRWYGKNNEKIKRVRIEDAERECRRFEAARLAAREELRALYDRALREVGETGAQIFDIHVMMLDDEDYRGSVENIIRAQQVNAEYAVGAASDRFSQMLANMDDEYMRARAVDVNDVSGRVLSQLGGGKRREIESDSPFILAADDLTPGETVQLDKTQILAFVTAGGSVSSHTAILARSIGIAAVVALKGLDSSCDGAEAVVDGGEGALILEPDSRTLAAYCEKKAAADEKKRLREALKGLPNRTVDGREIDVFANISTPEDAVYVLQNDAGGIGLFRSEFLFLQKDSPPDEEEQFEAFRAIAEKAGGKKVIIRTLDIGADKKTGYLGLPEEENPALGYRAIRICLDRPELFRPHLRAIYRASAYGNIAVMFPMITSLSEVLEIKRFAAGIRAELKEEGTPFRENVELGIMIETPAAALISDSLAREVDFFSIGTNDLSQYTLAVDRQNQSLGRFFDPRHPAVLSLIEATVKNAHKAGIRAGICGELGADTGLTEFFLRLGVDELSVSPAKILSVRERIRELDLSH